MVFWTRSFFVSSTITLKKKIFFSESQMLKLHFLHTSTRYIFDLGKKCMLMQYYVAARLGKCSIDSLIEASSLELYMYVLLT